MPDKCTKATSVKTYNGVKEMSIIMVDYEDAYERADRFGKMSEKCADFSETLKDEAGIAQRLEALSARFSSLSADIRRGADVWEEFYRTNIRL